MAWNDTKAAEDDFTSSDYNAMVTDQETRAVASSAAGAPSTTPANLGDIYIDKTNLKIYIATGTSSSADWKKVVSQ